MQQLGRENLQLMEELKVVKINAVATQQELERKLAFTIEMLNKAPAGQAFGRSSDRLSGALGGVFGCFGLLE